LNEYQKRHRRHVPLSTIMHLLLTTLNAKYIHINLAIRLLYEHNKQVPGLAWKEFTIKEDKNLIADYCSAFDVVAFSCYIWNISQTLEVARRIKVLRPDVKILLGGPEVSYDWEDVICREEVDYIIAGEGEIPFQQFLHFYPEVDQVNGLIQKKNGTVVIGATAPSFNLLEYQGIMPYQADGTELENRVAYIETSRGCPYKCEFCLASLDNKVRYLPIETIKAHLLYLMQHGKVIKFLDRTFNIKRDFTIDIFQFILEHHRPGNVFQFEITADILHPDIIQFIHDHVTPGLFRFEVGIQTVNQKANLEVSRKQSFEKTKRIVKELDYKIEMHLDLIVGLPLDYWEDIKYSFEEVFKLFAPELQLGFLKFLKGTPVRHKYEQHGYVFDPEPPYQIIESNYLSKEELYRITQLEHALEIYWNKKRAPNSLRYITSHYSVFDFLLGLGIYFGQYKAYHKYTLDDVFELLEQFVRQSYPNDPILIEMMAIDYYSYFKIRPRFRIITDVQPSRRHDANGLKYWQIQLDLQFDYETFQSTGQIERHPSRLYVRYDGIHLPNLSTSTVYERI
jgi:anaerobic magnesium-protoporphyrin IX monomethyl ester cyclase